jgi:hypothetical protein
LASCLLANCLLASCLCELPVSELHHSDLHGHHWNLTMRTFQINCDNWLNRCWFEAFVKILLVTAMTKKIIFLT